MRGRGTGGGPPVNREPPKKGPTLPPKIEKKADVPRNVIYTRDGRMIDVTMISDNESLILERVEGHANVTAPSTTHSSVKKYSDDEGKHNLTSRTKRDEEGKIMPFSPGITLRDKDGKAVPFSFFGGVDAFGGLFNGLTSMMSSTTSTTTAKTPRRDPAAAPSQKKRPDSSAEKSSPSAKPRKKDGGSSSSASGTPSASKKQIPKLQQAGETAAAASPTSPRASPAETVRRRGLIDYSRFASVPAWSPTKLSPTKQGTTASEGSSQKETARDSSANRDSARLKETSPQGLGAQRRRLVPAADAKAAAHHHLCDGRAAVHAALAAGQDRDGECSPSRGEDRDGECSPSRRGYGLGRPVPVGEGR